MQHFLTKEKSMKTVYDHIEPFAITGVKPGALSPDDSSFENLNHNSFPGKWKVIMFYPKDFTFVCPTEIVAYDALVNDFNDRDAILMTGSTDNEFCKESLDSFSFSSPIGNFSNRLS